MPKYKLLGDGKRPSVRHPKDLADRFQYEDGEEVITSGAASLLVRTTRVNVTGTQAYSLADGNADGQKKTFICTVAASTPVGTLTPAKRVGFASVNLDAVGESVTLQWNAAADGWAITGVRGAVVS